MADLTEDIRNALRYIEDNLTGELEPEEIAKEAHLSPFTSSDSSVPCAESAWESISAADG